MKKYKVNVNGNLYEITLEVVDGADVKAPVAAAPAAPAAAPAQAPAGGEKINAPMPGTILDVKVANGQAVKKGDVLMILEAMKMENEILAPCDGTVDAVSVTKGASVETGALLCAIK
ncbi:MAG: acetyl-CoA carboxylase biotin carboxyl carrier protein subunit [Ruminococcaceae bacterium]|nr:acetyl-CoA carboxylase biotin carboxyl carrier protein subunit [Oscillospiraceae bacterium]